MTCNDQVRRLLVVRMAAKERAQLLRVSCFARCCVGLHKAKATKAGYRHWLYLQRRQHVLEIGMAALHGVEAAVAVH